MRTIVLVILILLLLVRCPLGRIALDGAITQVGDWGWYCS